MDVPSGTASTTAPASPAVAAAPEPLKIAYHVVIGVAIGLVALFTVFAWPFGILTGMVIGRDDADRRQGLPSQGRALRILAVTGGVLGMFIAGAFIGGVIAFFVAALAAFSERVAANATPTDRTMARLIICIVAVVVWFGAATVLHLNIAWHIGL